MTRLVVHNTREKKVFHVTREELKKGEWLKLIPDSDLVEIQWKNNFLTIADAKIRRQEGEKHEGDEPNGRNKNSVEHEDE
jgi:hypothetical protein